MIQAWACTIFWSPYRKKKKMTAAKRFVPNVAKQLYKLENLKPTKLEESREKGGNNNF